MENELIYDFSLFPDVTIPGHISVQKVLQRPARKKSKASLAVSYVVHPSTVVKRKEKTIISDITKSEADNLRETFRIIVDAITEEHPNSDEPQIVRSPLKTRPQSKRKSSEPIRCLSNLDGSWGGSRPGAGRLSKKERLTASKRLSARKKLKVFRKNNKQRHNRRIRREIKLSKRALVYNTYVDSLQKALSRADFSDIFQESFASASVYQITKLTNQANALLVYYKTFLQDLNMNKMLVCMDACSVIPLKLSSHTLTRWVLDFEKNEGRFSESKRGKFERKWILNEEDLKNKAIVFIKNFSNQTNQWTNHLMFQTPVT